MNQFLSQITVLNGLVQSQVFSYIAAADLPVSGVTPAEYYAATVRIDAYGRVTSASSGPSFESLVDASPIVWNIGSPFDSASVTLHGSTTRLITVTGLTNGGKTDLKITQGSGNDSLTWDTMFDFGLAGTPALSVGQGELDVVQGFSDGAKLYCVFYPGYNFVTTPSNGIVDSLGDFFVDGLGNYWVYD